MSAQDPIAESGTLSNITLYPIKSLEGISVERAEVLPNGTLKHDRRFSFFGKKADTWIRAKVCPELIRIQTRYDLAARTVTLAVDGEKHTYDLADTSGRNDLGKWMSGFLKQEVELRECKGDAFFDDGKRGRYGISLISVATMRRATEWFPDLTVDEIQRRMRMNLVVDEVGPLWEEAVVREDRKGGIQIGQVTFLDPWPCSRCTVPARDSHSAEMDDSFADAFKKHRQANAPENARLKALSDRDDFNGFFTLGIRTSGRGEDADNEIAVGDRVRARA